MTLFYTYWSHTTRRKKFYILLAYIAIAFLAFIGLSFSGTNLIPTVGKMNFDSIDFWNSFTTWSYQLRFDTIFLLFILPLTVALYFTARKGIQHANSVLGLIAGAIISMTLLAALTGYNLHPYRYVPLVVFFAVGVGTLLSKNSSDGSENGSN
jgi:hypothetical protein